MASLASATAWLSAKSTPWNVGGTLGFCLRKDSDSGVGIVKVSCFSTVEFEGFEEEGEVGGGRQKRRASRSSFFNTINLLNHWLRQPEGGDVFR